MTAIAAACHRKTPCILGVLAAILAGGSLMVWWVIHETDLEMRTALLQHGQVVAQAVNIDSIHALTGQEKDINSPVYQSLKEQLVTLRAASPEYRFIYLLGRKTDESLFFFVDSEKVGSEGYSPPGQVYDEATTLARDVFATRSAAVEGPVRDRWGRWVSPLVPILDPHTVMYGLATPKEAQAMARKAVDFYRKNGRERLLAEVNNPKGEFCKGDCYVFVYDRNMTWLAHPVKPELVGQNWINKKDWSGGKYFRREIQEVARHGQGWVEFEYLNPLNGQHDHKTAYVQGMDDLVICSGAYRGDGEISAVLGMDIDASDWNKALVRAALPPVMLTLMLVLVLSLGFAFLKQRYRLASGSPRWMRHLDSAMVAASGLVLTLLVAWLLHHREAHDRKAAFEQLASSRTEAITNTLTDIGATSIEGLARFCGHGVTVLPDGFRRYTDFLIKTPVVHSWAWVPRVNAADKSRYEEAVRLEGPKFKLWEKDAKGKAVALGERSIYYPVAQLEPQAGNESLLGYDLGSESFRRSALEAAARTGLSMATGPTTLVHEKGTQQAMAVYRPVFLKDDTTCGGYVMAILKMSALLKRAAPDSSAILDLTLLHQAASAEQLATTRGGMDALPDNTLVSTRPIFAFGKVFLVTAHAGPEFMHLHPVRAGGMALFAGLGLTAALTLVIRVVLRQRQELERLVLERTNELKESEQAYHDQFANNSAVMLLIDPSDGAIIGANAVAATFYGYSRQRLQAMHIHDLNPEASTEIKAYASVRQEQGRVFSFQHRLANGLLRDVEVSASQIQFGARVVLHAIIFDVTERKRAEEERTAMNRQLEGLNILGELLLEPASLETKLAAITNGIVIYFEADFCRIWLIRPGDLCRQGCVHAAATAGSPACPRRDKCLHLLASSGSCSRDDDISKGRMPLGFQRVGRLAADNEHKLVLNNLAEDPCEHDREWARNHGLVSFVGYQLRVSGREPIGVLALYSKRPILPAEDAMLDGLCSAVALTVQQAATEEAFQKTNDELRSRGEQQTTALTRTNEALRREIEELKQAKEAETKTQT